MQPKVSVIVLNYNSVADTIECVRSLQHLTYSNVEVVLVDNGSDNDEVGVLQRECPDLPLLQSGANVGYAAGNNLGITYALKNGAEYVWILNNDTVVDPEALSQMVLLAESENEIGMVGSKIYFHSEKDMLWYAGATFDVATGGVTSHIGWGRKDKGQFDHILDVDYITGCSLLVKKEVIDIIGSMPEEYFLYFEEADWNMAARAAGFRTVIATKSLIWHKVKRTGKAHARFVYYMTRNRFLLIKKVKPDALFACMKYQFAEGTNLLKEFWRLKQYKEFWKYGWILIRAWADALLFHRQGSVSIGMR